MKTFNQKIIIDALKRITAYWKYLAWTMIVLASTGFVCCTHMDSVEGETPDTSKPEQNGSAVSVSFSLKSGNVPEGIATRADGDGHAEGPGDLPDMYENTVNINDMAFYVFSQDKLVYQSNEDDDFRTVTGASGLGYNVRIRIPSIRIDVGPESPSTFTFRLVVLANLNTGADSDNEAYGYPVFAQGTSFENVMSGLEELQFSLPDKWDPANLPSAGTTRHIPLFGSNSFTVSRQDLIDSEPSNVIALGYVNLLRAVAKLEIIDGISEDDRDDEGYPRLSDVRFTYGRTNGFLLPADAASYIDGWQVTQTNQCETVLPAVNRDMRYIGGTMPDGTGISLFRAYCPEQVITDTDPSVEITVQPFRGAAEQDLLHYTVPLSGYNGVMFTDFGTGILRNHVYRIEVTKVNIGTPAVITVSVLDWDSEEIIWDYSDNPGLADGGEIRWVDGTYVSIVEGATLVVKNDSPAVCNFTLSSPVNAEWRAVLIPEGQSQDAFTFVDSDGAASEQMSGTIDGSPVELRIMATDPTPSELKRARLYITVTTPDGRTVTADVCNGKYGQYKYFTLLQNPQL